jgi:fructose-bisphosphate aldolase class II
MSEKTATLDIQRITEIAKEVDAPLVLHGSSGVSKEQLMEAIDAGLRKINLSTELNKAFTESIRATLTADNDLIDPRKYISPARSEVEKLVTGYLEITR